MKQRELIDFLNKIEKLKCFTRHSWTSSGRHESIAEHSWRLAVMAMLVADEFPKADINKVIKMCLVHDFGEAITGDVPSFYKTEENEQEEDKAVENLLNSLPEKQREELKPLFVEMENMQTVEAKLWKGLDNMEVLIAHNEAPISTWIDLEYKENLTYGAENVEWSTWLKELKEEIKREAIEKMDKGL